MWRLRRILVVLCAALTTLVATAVVAKETKTSLPVWTKTGAKAPLLAQTNRGQLRGPEGGLAPKLVTDDQLSLIHI